MTRLVWMAVFALVLLGVTGCIHIKRSSPEDAGDAVVTDAAPDVQPDGPVGPGDVDIDADADTDAAADAVVDTDTPVPAPPGPSVTPAYLVGTSDGDGWRLRSIGTGTALRGSSSSPEGWTLQAME